MSLNLTYDDLEAPSELSEQARLDFYVKSRIPLQRLVGVNNLSKDKKLEINLIVR